MIIKGKKQTAKRGKEIQILNPATGELLDTVPEADEEDIDEIITIANEGKNIWADTPLHQRSEILRRFIEIVTDQKQELAVLLSKETGKIVRESLAEVDTLIRVFRGYIEKANHFYGKTMPDCQPGFEKDIIFTKREPLGVMVLIIPFNYPIDLFSHKAAPALITGNAIIVKPSSENPLAIGKLVECLLEAGVPDTAVQLITGRGAVVGKYLVSNEGIDGVSLTGSTYAGVEIAKNCAEHLHRFFLELGGNDGLIVFEDADVDLAVKEAIHSRISNAGQTCCASKRFIVQNSIVDEFTTKLIEELKTIQIGNPLDPKTDMGCLISKRAALEVKDQVDDTIKQNARCLYGGNIISGAFFEPTVLGGVSPEMDIAKDLEIFGPVFPIISFAAEEEAIQIVNNSMYGLMGGVITQDINRGIRVASKMKSGGIVINGAGNYRPLEIPFGGYKMSGLGREGISYTLEEMTQVKSYILKKIL